MQMASEQAPTQSGSDARPVLSADAYRRIDREIAKYPPEHKQSAVMAALSIAQQEKGWLASETIEDVARYLDMPPIAVQEVATFYTMYNTRPVGRFKISVCTNLPCHLRDGTRAADYLKAKLGVDFNGTTEDGMFTLKEGECMGACGDAPVLLVNDRRMDGYMDFARLDALIEKLRTQGN